MANAAAELQSVGIAEEVPAEIQFIIPKMILYDLQRQATKFLSSHLAIIIIMVRSIYLLYISLRHHERAFRLREAI